MTQQITIMNYEINYDGIYSSIQKTNKEVNTDMDIYPTYPQAKKELIKYIKQRVWEWQEALTTLRSTNDCV